MAFAGTVFFEVVLLANVHNRVPSSTCSPWSRRWGHAPPPSCPGVASAVFCGSRRPGSTKLGIGAPLGQQYRHADGAQDCAGA
ncbi:hypothetical protein J4714_14295 [Staphylococcus epidermidis]|nr:hypothetical protein [Staphylococcus epidermidis]